MKFFATLLLVLSLGGCALTDIAQEYFNQKVNEAVEQGKQAAQQEVQKQVDNAVNSATETAKGVVANQINTARNQLTGTIDSQGKALIDTLTTTPTPKVVPTKKPTATPILTGTFLYLRYSPTELARAKTEKVLLFFSDSTNWALDKYFTVTEDLTKNNITILQVDSTKDQTLKNKYNPGNGDVVIQIDASGKELTRIEGEPYSQQSFLSVIDSKVK